MAKSDNLTHLPDDEDVPYPHRVEPATATIAVFAHTRLFLGEAMVNIAARDMSWEQFCLFDDAGNINMVVCSVGYRVPSEWKTSAAEAMRRMGKQIKRRKWDSSTAKVHRQGWLKDWASEEGTKLEVAEMLDRLGKAVTSEWREIGWFIAKHGEGGVNWWVGDWRNLLATHEEAA